MKNLFLFTLSLISLTFLASQTFAQSEELRNKIQLIITHEGKSITADLNSLSTTISRTSEEDIAEVKTAADTSKTKLPSPGTTGSAFYLSFDIKQMSNDLLKVFARKKTRFDGTITITDSYGKNAPRSIKFKQASLYNYSDQFSSASYGDTYGSSVIAIMCKEVAINGITIEQ